MPVKIGRLKQAAEFMPQISVLSERKGHKFNKMMTKFTLALEKVDLQTV